MNVALVLITSVTGLLLASAHQGGLQKLLQSDVALLIPMTSILLSTFQLRHLDHEINIADYGAYVRSVLRPQVAELVEKDVLQYEMFIDGIRRRRTHRLAGVLILGNEAFQLLVLSVVAAGLSVITWVWWWMFAGMAITAFTLAMVVALLFVVVSLWQTAEMLRHYKTVDEAVEAWREAL